MADKPVMSEYPIFEAREKGRSNTHVVFNILNRGRICGEAVILTGDALLFRKLLEGGEWIRGGQPVEYEVRDG